MIKSETRLLALRGELNEAALRAERISPEEVYSALRSAGRASLADVEAVVLETDGSFSVIPAAPGRGPALALRRLEGYPAGE